MKEVVRKCKEIARFRSLQNKHCVGGREGGALLNKEGVVVCLSYMKEPLKQKPGINKKKKKKLTWR